MVTPVLPMKGLAQALSSDLLKLGLSSSLLGILLHVSILCYLPVEEYLNSLLGVYTASVVALGAAYISITELALVPILVRVSWIATAFNIGLASSIVVYRVFFHRLRRFPGPVLASISRFYDTYLAGRAVQYNVEIEKLHDTYGDFIRTGTVSRNTQSTMRNIS